MVSRGGDPIAIPHVRGAEAIAWSPDERYVAIATDERNGDRPHRAATSVMTTLPFGAHALAWLT